MNLTSENMFTPFANRHGVKVIAATPIEDGRWSIVAVRVKTVCGKRVSEYVAWEFSEDNGVAYNGCYCMQNADEYSDENAFMGAMEVHDRRVAQATERVRGEARARAMEYVNDFQEA